MTTLRPAEGQTRMAREARQAPEAVSRLLPANAPLCQSLAERFAAAPPKLVATCARGSSDHAATYAKYLIETGLGLPVLSAAPSVGSVYGRRMALQDSLFLVISQSGESPDLVANVGWAKENGAFVVALVNRSESPVAAAADAVLPLHAGTEAGHIDRRPHHPQSAPRDATYDPAPPIA